MITASAPGKLVLMGEYAVLRGHPAVVAAVDVRAVCKRQGGPLAVAHDEGGLIAACLQEAGEGADGALSLDTSAFRAGNAKYGLGSSAAACVALLRALLPHIQLDELHARSQRAHRAFQKGKGSGVDVCASVYGGITRFVRPIHRGDDDVTEATPAPPLPAGVTLLPVWTGVSADTRAFIAAVEPHLERRAEHLRAATDRFLAAKKPHDLFIAVEDAGLALLHLGMSAGVDIISRQHDDIRRIARRHGGAGKPSGAGGGDVALCFVPDENVRECRNALVARGFSVLDFSVGAPGVVVDGA